MANTGLTRTNGTPTLATKCTISAWVKRCGTAINVGGKDEVLAETYSNDSNFCFFRFDGGDHINAYALGIGAFSVTTTAKFRDPNAFYHVVLAIDTTQGTAADRVKIYVNGVQQTTSGTQPSQDSNAAFNTSGDTFQIGDSNRYASHEFDGIMSHYHFIDGAVYQASTFGSTDATTGEWKINTSPSVTYGTNGFFILKNSNSVTDQSGNGNNLTVANGTLTNTEDNPSNVFATINILQGAIASGYTVANGNLGVTGNTGGAWRSLPATLAVSSGKFYWEVKITGFSTGMHFGVQDVAQAPQSNAYAYQYSRAYVYKDDGLIANNNITASYGNSWTTNDIVGVAVDLDNNKIYFSKNGTFQNSGVPTSGSTGTGAAYTLASGYSYTPMFSTYASGDTFQYNFGNGFFGTTAISSEGTNASGIGKFEYDVPTGYTALSTKGLNE